MDYLHKENLIRKYCSDIWLPIIDQYKSIFKFDVDEYIIKQGNKVSGIYFICKGKAKVTISDKDGNEQIVRLAKDGQILGHRGYGEGWFYPISAIALTPAEVLFIPKHIFDQVLKGNPEFCYQLLLFYSEELRSSEFRAYNMNLMTVRQRVADALLYIAEVFGYEEKKKNTLSFMLKRREIAQMVNTTYESVVRTLGDLNASGIVKIEGKGLSILDEKKLTQIKYGYE